MSHVSWQRGHRVLRVGGSEADEWIPFRGPVYVELDPSKSVEANERAETQLLLVDKYVTVLREARPVSVSQKDAGEARYCLVEYGADVLGILLGTLWRAFSAPGMSEPMRLWVNVRTNYLVRADFSILVGLPQEEPTHHRIVQGFAGYNELPDIAPPSFQLMHA